MALVGFQYQPVSYDVNKVCFDEEQDIPKTREKSKNQSATEWCRCGKYGVMGINIECLVYGEIKTLGYFQLSDMR